jgi:2-hydroxy-3-keto-5-methylthiopentenyl-1-phosphate phosphatase
MMVGPPSPTSRQIRDFSKPLRAYHPDLSAAKHADVLFAKVMANGDSDLLEYCKRENIPNVPFKDL